MEEQHCTHLAYKAVMRKLHMLVADFPDTYSLTVQDEVSKELLINNLWINSGDRLCNSTPHRIYCE